ncbi:MAG: hypothetical protein ABIA75_09075 [Candidatus Neomarinimicrobiota bacterium]
MRFSRILLLLATTIAVPAQTVVVSISATGLEFSAGDSLAIVQRLDSLLLAAGDWGSQFSLSGVNRGDDLRLDYSLQTHRRQVDSLVFSDDGEIALAVKRMLFRHILAAESPGAAESVLSRIRETYPFLNEKTELAWGRYADDRIAAVIRVRPDFASSFSGIAGLSREADRDWQLTGQLDLHLENAWRSAGTVDIEWRRKDELSQNIALAIEEPHPLSLPIGLTASFRQNLEQGWYVQKEISAGVVAVLADRGQWRLGSERITVVPTEKGDSAGVTALTSNLLFCSGSGDSRDDRWLPQKGGTWQFYGAFGERKTATASRSGRYQLQAAYYFRVLPLLSFHPALRFQGTTVKQAALHQSEMVKFGGTGSLRGYREDFFQAPWVMLTQLELIYRAGKNLQLLLFGDIGGQDVYRPLPFGLGLALVQRSAGTIVEVGYGIGRSDRLAEGKLHVRLTGRL